MELTGPWHEHTCNPLVPMQTICRRESAPTDLVPTQVDTCACYLRAGQTFRHREQHLGSAKHPATFRNDRFASVLRSGARFRQRLALRRTQSQYRVGRAVTTAPFFFSSWILLPTHAGLLSCPFVFAETNVADLCGKNADGKTLMLLYII